MKRVFFTCFLAIMLVSAVLTAGCTERNEPSLLLSIQE